MPRGEVYNQFRKTLIKIGTRAIGYSFTDSFTDTKYKIIGMSFTEVAGHNTCKYCRKMAERWCPAAFRVGVAESFIGVRVELVYQGTGLPLHNKFCDDFFKRVSPHEAMTASVHRRPNRGKTKKGGEFVPNDGRWSLDFE